MESKKQWTAIPGYSKFETDGVSVRSVKKNNIQSKQGTKYRLYDDKGERQTISLEEILVLVSKVPVPAEVKTEKTKGALPGDLMDAKALKDHKPELTDKAVGNVAKEKKDNTPKAKKEKTPGIKDAVLALHKEGKGIDEMLEANPTWKRNTVYIIIKIAKGNGTKDKVKTQ